MTLIEAADVDLEHLDMDRWTMPDRISDGHRSTGIHLTDILAHLWFGSLPIDSPQRKAKEQEAHDELEGRRVYPLKMALGLAWEHFAAGLYPSMAWQPGEFERDGITGSPDGYSMEGDTLVIEEFKSTWKSARRDILKEILWMWQVTGYAAMLDALTVRLHVVYWNGTYTHPYQPIYRRYLLQLDRDEREQLWTTMIVPASKDLYVNANRIE